MLTSFDIKRYLKIVDVVLEVVEARLPASSRPSELASVLKAKEAILVLNKADLANPLATRRWLDYYRAQGQLAVDMNSQTGEGLPGLRQLLQKLANDKKEKLSRRGILHSPLRVMVVGIPNVGKSSLLNRLVGRAVARTGDRPGITRGPQWVRKFQEWEVLDTPGILGISQKHERITLLLYALGCIPGREAPPEKVAEELIYVLQEQGWRRQEGFEEILDSLGRERGFLKPGGEVDRVKAAQLLLREFRQGKLGRFTLEWPP
ncbi:MAG: ribosome biogenesis GTPase YlqF [Thermanaeromonas sp.]|uniref:ribosome biogenesis GTPase YlqF n=1 Tax=Thermanaeromonas sp. TaxID=2003697 RepID=UPI0024405839|nr:ribosome biogenesis GTPase YlqF [Thermanaeromonas sp.]MCG0277207.1 ribosome biogenesis GTPase YlqF [Thermanaeromonas sp.]